MPQRIRFAAVALFTALAAGPLHGQEIRVVPRGTRLRVSTVDRQNLRGRMAFVSPDELGVIDENGDQFYLRVDNIARVEVTFGNQPLSGKWAAIGAGIGTAAGLGIGALLDAESALLTMGAVGLTTGAILGAGGSSSVIRASVGLLIGGAVGAVFGASARQENDDLTTAEAAAAWGAFLGGIGMYTGGLLGWVNRPEVWEPVPVDRIRVTLNPQRGGRVGLGLRTTF